MESTIRKNRFGERVKDKASVPYDAWKPRTTVVLHQKSLRHHRSSVTRHNRSRRRRRHRSSNLHLLRYHGCWFGSLHRSRLRSFYQWVFFLSLIDLNSISSSFWVFVSNYCWFWMWIAALCPLYYYYQRHPVNYLLLGVFTLSLSFVVGLSCAFTSGKILLIPFLFFPFAINSFYCNSDYYDDFIFHIVCYLVSIWDILF